MALDIHRLDNDEHIFGLDNDGLYIIFEQFKKRTGIEIDWYGDTILNIENQKLLVQLIDEYIKRTDLNINKKLTTVVLEFRGLLNMFIKKNILIKSRVQERSAIK